MAMSQELNARQRKNVYMHSTIFDTEGPTGRSVYTPATQHELNNKLGTKLRQNNRAPPDLQLPSPADIQCTQNAGHNVVLPAGAGEVAPRHDLSMRTSGPQALVGDGDVMPIVQAGGKDKAIPREFWATSVNLQWHDPRNELHRAKGQQGKEPGDAAHKKRQELSSEVFGTERQFHRSTTNPKKELLADTADHFKVDSSLDKQCHPGPHKSGDNYTSQIESKSARSRFQDNLTNHPNSSLAASASASNQMTKAVHDEDPNVADRRRQEKNFSDLFGSSMGERAPIRGNREEVVGTKTLSFLDTRSEIAVRNKGHWKPDEAEAAVHRKSAECNSNLFDFERPNKPPVEEHVKEIGKNERVCWDTKDIMHSGSEIARRRRCKDHVNDFEDSQGRTAGQRKHEDMGSIQMRLGMGSTEPPQHSPRMYQRDGRGQRMDHTVTAKDVKLASLQSSIFS